MYVILKILNRYPVLAEFVKFCLVGLTNLAVDFLVYTFFTRVLHLYYILAAILSFIVAVTWSFYINKKWTFKYRPLNIKSLYFKFFIANTVSIIFNLVVFYCFVEYLHIPDLLAKFLSSVITAFINFSINKFWTFQKKF